MALCVVSLMSSFMVEPAQPDRPADVLPAVDFVGCPTPTAWLEQAVRHQDILLIDHANCEKKAASTALNLMFRYVDRPELLTMLAQLAREELLHFEQVLALMQQRGVTYQQIGASRYAAGLRSHVRTTEPGRLVDTLIVGAFIEARSCERFAALAPWLDEELGRYYRFLLRSEERHYADYLALARRYAGGEDSGSLAAQAFDDRVVYFRQCEAELVTAPDDEFRFHSGAPSS